MLEQILEQLKNFIFWGNSGYAYLKAIILFLGLLIILKIFREIILAKLKKLAQKTVTDLDDILMQIIEDIRPPFYLIFSIYIPIKILQVHFFIDQGINIILIIILIYQGISAIDRLVLYILQKNNKGSEKNSSSDIIRLIIRIVLWAVGLTLVLGNLGVDITSLIAGLGIGGIAIALALQNILKDLFASLSILIDKPFEIGDFIVIGSDMGTVEKIGIKTTRLRSLDGQQLIIANNELTDTRVQNFKRLKKRRALFNLDIVYETEEEKLNKIPKLIQEIIEKKEGNEFDRCHFKSFGDFSLKFEISYYVNTKDYKEYLDMIEKINLAIVAEFRKENIEFAYPTQVEYSK